MRIPSASKKNKAFFALNRFFLSGIFFAFLCSVQPAFADDSVKIKILAVNPSTTKPLKTIVTQYLPPEVGPDDVLDKEGLEIKYDTEKRAYAVLKSVELKPQETITIEVKVRNVWVITPEQIEEVKVQLKQSSGALSKTKFAKTGQLLYEKASESLAQIEENQTKSLGIMQRIELYRSNMRQLDDLKLNALSLEAMRKMEDEKTSGVRDVKFVVSAENPSLEEKKLSVRSSLPKGIKETDVLDKGGFELIYDEKGSSFVLERQDTLGPKEIRKYEVKIKDIWYISKAELDFLKSEIEKLVSLFKKSPYEDFAAKHKESVLKSLQLIDTLQTEVSSSTNLDDRIRAHVLNQQRENSAKRKIKELQDLLSEVNLRSGDGAEDSPFQKMVAKLVDIKNRVMMALGNQPNKSILWWFFLGVVLFLAVITIVFYSAWLKKLQNNKWVQSPKTKSNDAPKNESNSDPQP